MKTYCKNIEKKICQFLSKEDQIETNKCQYLCTKNSKKFIKISSVIIAFANNEKLPLQSISNLRADQIGHLIVTKGIVTRVSEVKP